MTTRWERQAWDQGVTNYNSPSVIKEESMMPFLASDDLKDIYHGKNILDLGCGPGHFAKVICEKFSIKSFTGVDHSQSFIDFANGLDIKANIKPNFLNGDARNIKLEYSPYNTILSINVIPTMSTYEDFKNLLCTISNHMAVGSKAVIMSTNDRCVLSGKHNESFQISLVDGNSTPIKCNLKVKNIDGQYFEFSDNCWTREQIESELKANQIQIQLIKEIGGSKSFPEYYPFIVFIAEKIN